MARGATGAVALSQAKVSIETPKIVRIARRPGVMSVVI
jgi:hypothetical protein